MVFGWVRSINPLGRSVGGLSRYHPYSPANVPIPAFRPNTSPVWVLVASFGAIVATVLAATVLVSRRYNRKIKAPWALCWFALSGFFHIFFEGYFIINHDRIAGMQGLFAQLWKEYALSDSRYLTLNPFILSIETLTVLIWGPLCIAAAVSIVRDSPLRHPLQLIVSVGHCYGVLLYFATSAASLYADGRAHSRPEFLYFWVYFVAANLAWLAVPMFLLVDSVKSMQKAMMVMLQVESALVRKQRTIQPPPPPPPPVPEVKREKRRYKELVA